MRNRRFPKYPDDTDYTTNSPSYYDDLARKQKLIQLLAEKIWEYEKTLDLTLEQITNRLESYIEENDTLMNERLEQWDLNLEKFPENVELLLQEWLSDGTLDHIINETIFNWKADKTYVDAEIERLEQKDDNIITLLEEKASIEQMNRFELSVKVSSFGGIPDDESVDNLSAIQEAIDFVHNAGGGKVVFDGIYYTDATIYLKDNVCLDGMNRTGGVKLIHTASPFYDLFRIVKISNWGITGLYIDSSFEERSVPYDISKNEQSEIMISLEGAINGFVINNEIYGNGKWLFSSHAGATPYRVTDYSRNIRVEDNYFEWFAGQSTQSPNMPEGVFLDNTAVYFDAVDYTFKDNTVVTDYYPQTMTALELHCALATATNNRLIGFRRGVILVSYPLDPIEEVIVEDNYIRFEGNVIEKCLQGIAMTIFEGYNLDSVSVLNNRIYPDPTVFTGFAGVHGMLFVDGEPDPAIKPPIKALQIEGNYIYFDEWLESFTESDHVVNYTGIRIGIGVHEGLSISNNTIINAPATGITILNRSIGYVTVKSGVIQNNTIINAGRNTNMVTEEWNPRTAIRVVDSARTTIEQLIIGENNIIDTRENGTYFTAPTYVLGNAYLKGQNILTTDGIIHDVGGDKPYIVPSGYDNFLETDSIDNFPSGITATNVSFNKARALNFPEDRSGTLTTYKFSEGEHGFNYQTYRVHGGGDYFRNVDITTGEQLEWTRQGDYKVGHQNETDASMSIVDFPLGVSVNIAVYPFVVGKDFPEEKGGTLITHKYSDVDHGFNWQEYKIHETTQIYIRTFNASGIPKEWELK